MLLSAGMCAVCSGSTYCRPPDEHCNPPCLKRALNVDPDTKDCGSTLGTAPTSPTQYS